MSSRPGHRFPLARLPAQAHPPHDGVLPSARIDPSGGFFHFFKDDGTIYDARHAASGQQHALRLQLRHGVPPLRRPATTRTPSRHGCAFLRNAHRDPATGGYAWLLRARATRCWTAPTTATASPSSLLAYAQGAGGRHRRGPGGTRRNLRADGAPLLVAEATGSTRDEIEHRLDTSRPIAARTPTCTAARPCSRPTRRPVTRSYLDRAATLARARHASTSPRKADGLVWEHYRRRLVDRLGLQPGRPEQHLPALGLSARPLTEWAKLLLILERHRPADWLLPTARHLFDTARSGPGTPSYGGISTASRPTIDLRRRQVLLGAGRELRRRGAARARAPARSATGTGTTGIWDYCWRALGRSPVRRLVSHPRRATTASTATRRAPPARPTTTRWAPATRC